MGGRLRPTIRFNGLLDGRFAATLLPWCLLDLLEEFIIWKGIKSQLQEGCLARLAEIESYDSLVRRLGRVWRIGSQISMLACSRQIKLDLIAAEADQRVHGIACHVSETEGKRRAEATAQQARAMTNR